MNRSALLTVIALTLTAVSCGRMHQPSLEEDFIDPDDLHLRECSEDTIRALSLAISADDRDPELFRRLSVCLRAVGTPEARLRSMRAIDRAIELDPMNPDYHVEKGLTLYARQFIHSALSSLDKAIELDPGCFQAWYHRGRIRKDLYLRNMTSEKDLKEAVRSFSRAEAIYGKHAETLIDLGVLMYLEGRLGASSRRAVSGERYYPGDYRFRLLAASVALERMQFEEAAAGFDSALAMMDGTLRMTFEDVSPLLPAEEWELYVNLEGRNRSEFNRKFWVMNDPTPSTPLNERRLEHYRRVFLATMLLTNERLGLKGVRTARGGALVRYGLPRNILLNIGSGLDGPFVVWTYRSGGQVFPLYFQDEFLSGDYHIPIDPKFTGYASITEGILQNVPQIYDYPVEYRQIPVESENVISRGDSGMTRLDISIALAGSGMDMNDHSYLLTLTLFDHDLNVFTTKSLQFDPDTLKRFEKISGDWLDMSLYLEVPPLELESSLAVEISGGRAPGRAVFRSPVTIEDLSGGHLCLSDIRLLLKGSEGGCTGIIDPIPSYRTGASLCLSWDTYSLKRDEGNLTRSKVTWSVLPADSGAGPSSAWEWIKSSVRGEHEDERVYISNSVEQRGSDRDSSDSLVIDISTLEPGRYLLRLEVEDMVSGFKAQRWRQFNLIPRNRS